MHANLSGRKGSHSGSVDIAASPHKSPGIATVGWWNTPRRLQAALPAIWLAALVFLMIVLVGARQHRLALQTIGNEVAPGIIAAQKIKAGLSDMDATAANVLLLNHGVQQEAADDHYEARRIEVTETLATILQGNNHSNEEIKAARDLSTALATYENDVTVARLLHLRSELGSRLVYRMTHSEMHDALLPDADKFDKAARSAMEATYTRQQWASRITLGLALVFGLVLLGVLIVIQMYLSRHMKRTLNPALLVATVLTAFLLFHTQQLFSQEAATLDAVKSAFTSVSDLWQTRALASDADSEESRWLMDTPQAPQYEQAYATQSALILSTASGDPVDATGMAQGSLPTGVKGSMANVVASAVTSEEKAAARKMLQAYGVFVGTDSKLRALEQSNRHSNAVDYCVGPHNLAFSNFNTALDAMLEKVQRTFTSGVEEGLGRFTGYDALAVVVLAATAILGWVGLRPRLREYAF